MTVSPPRTRPRPPDPPASRRVSPRRAAAVVLLAVPFVALLWVSSYDRTEPRLGGFPFFYWYQLMWVLITAVLTVVAYALYAHEDRADRERRDSVRRERREAQGGGR